MVRAGLIFMNHYCSPRHPILNNHREVFCFPMAAVNTRSDLDSSARPSTACLLDHSEMTQEARQATLTTPAII